MNLDLYHKSVKPTKKDSSLKLFTKPNQSHDETTTQHHSKG